MCLEYKKPANEATCHYSFQKLNMTNQDVCLLKFLVSTFQSSVIIAAILRDADHILLFGQLVILKTQNNVLFSWRRMARIGKITVKSSTAQHFYSHIKAGKFRGRRVAWRLYFSQQSSQCSHTYVAARRITKYSRGFRRKGEKETETVREKEIGVSRADCANYSEPVLQHLMRPRRHLCQKEQSACSFCFSGCQFSSLPKNYSLVQSKFFFFLSHKFFRLTSNDNLAI